MAWLECSLKESLIVLWGECRMVWKPGQDLRQVAQLWVKVFWTRAMSIEWKERYKCKTDEIQSILKLILRIGTNLSFTDEKRQDRDVKWLCWKLLFWVKVVLEFLTPNLTYFIDDTYVNFWHDWIFVLENWQNIDGTTRGKKGCMYVSAWEGMEGNYLEHNAFCWRNISLICGFYV